jgi:uptake hydrogenase large subunit
MADGRATTVPIEGELIVRLDCEGNRIRKVTVQSTRPMLAARVLKGKTARDAAATVPMLFSICGVAQSSAAVGALAAAGAKGLDADMGSRDRDVMLESLQDAFRHLLIDWPDAMGGEPCAAPVAAARREIASCALDGAMRRIDAQAMRALGTRLSAIAAEAIFGMPVTAWLELAKVDALRAWCANGGTFVAIMLGQLFARDSTLGKSAIPLMPPAQRDTLVRVIVPALRAEPQFARAPTWGGAPVETGALARMRNEPLVAAMHEQFGSAVVTRIVARLVELGLLILELTKKRARTEAPPRIQRMSIGDGEGLAAVETARGLLLHRAHVHAERVVDYQIVAPTEWNFHANGALVRGLEGLEGDDDRRLLRNAQLAVHALDPCVAFRVEVAHA